MYIKLDNVGKDRERERAKAHSIDIRIYTRGGWLVRFHLAVALIAERVYYNVVRARASKRAREKGSQRSTTAAINTLQSIQNGCSIYIYIYQSTFLLPPLVGRASMI